MQMENLSNGEESLFQRTELSADFGFSYIMYLYEFNRQLLFVWYGFSDNRLETGLF